MRITLPVLLVGVCLLTACVTTINGVPKKTPPPPPVDTPETVMLYYYVKPDMVAVMQDVLAKSWVLYRREGLVYSSPHVVTYSRDAEGRGQFIEIFTWVNHAAPEKVSPAIQQLWSQMKSLCENRDGHGGLAGGEVDLVVPKGR